MHDDWIIPRWRRCVSVRCAVCTMVKARKLLQVFLVSIVRRSMAGWRSTGVAVGER